jgi:hypothetical protein
MDEKIRQALAVMDAYDAAHPYWRQEARERELKTAKEAEERVQQGHEHRRRAEQQRASDHNAQQWCNWVDQRIAEHIERDREELHAALSLAFDEEREDRRKEVKTALDEIQRTFETKFAALEQASNDRWGRSGSASFSTSSSGPDVPTLLAR